MIALDTNILIRLLTEDDAEQADRVVRFCEEHLSASRPGFISVVVTCELAWTLKSYFGFSDAQIRDAVKRLLDTEIFALGDGRAISAALERDCDFGDAIIHELGQAAGCDETLTFDQRFARMAGVSLLN